MERSFNLNLNPCCQIFLPYIMGFDIEINHQKFKWDVHTHHVVIIAMLTLCYSTMSHVTLTLFHHAFMLTLFKSVISCALWLPQVWYYEVESVLLCSWISNNKGKCPIPRLGEILFIYSSCTTTLLEKYVKNLTWSLVVHSKISKKH
jgi:hypothetical protein